MVAPRDGGLWTLANGLSVLRMVLGVGFPWIPAAWRLPAVAIAALSDALDGSAARYLGAASHTGQLLDPIADKVFVLGVVIALIWDGTLSIEEVALIGTRDWVVALGTLVLLIRSPGSNFHQLKPTYLGKLATAGQFGFFLLLLVVPDQKDWAILLVAGLSILAGIHYAWLFFSGALKH